MSARTAVMVMLAASVFLVIGVAHWMAGAPAGDAPSVGRPLVPRFVRRRLDDSLGAARRDVVAGDPFRLANVPAGVAFDPRGAITGPAVPVAAPVAPIRLRPAFVLRAIVGGPPWTAIVDGMPGQPTGLLVRGGERFDQIRVALVARDSVVLAGADTTWVLTFRSGR